MNTNKLRCCIVGCGNPHFAIGHCSEHLFQNFNITPKYNHTEVIDKRVEKIKKDKRGVAEREKGYSIDNAIRGKANPSKPYICLLPKERKQAFNEMMSKGLSVAQSAKEWNICVATMYRIYYQFIDEYNKQNGVK